ncbi:MAG: glycosyltransferase [Rhodovulum sulfidophilum]|uniref:Glycosyltransferase n=1 Tax=Rhodovulum sulfidophilum TaxID=35806 RepID=A0A2W5NI42_RHOSU|nr:MAG: glycosyltransferase [Rhodovulum sulfidophilum]
MRNTFSIRVRGVDIAVNMPDAACLLETVRERLRGGEGFAVATLNLDHLVKLRRFPRFRDAYARQDLVTADGNPIVWLSRLAGRPVSLVPGSDLVEPLVALATAEGHAVALLGSTETALARAAAHLGARHPGLRVAARLAPGRNFDPEGPEAGAMIDALRASGARLAFLALGAPKQEIFAARCRAALPALGIVSVGAGLDFLAATQRRAPAWVRRAALEWLWRAAADPRRLGRRYAECAIELPALAVGVARARG